MADIRIMAIGTTAHAIISVDTGTIVRCLIMAGIGTIVRALIMAGIGITDRVTVITDSGTISRGLTGSAITVHAGMVAELAVDRDQST
jgi:hypothetical protein